MALATRTLEMKNGLKVVVEEDHSSPIVGVVATVGVGSSSDPKGKEGLAHLVEHLAFRCKPDGRSQLSNLFARVGAGTFNAATSLDTTVYNEFGSAESLESLLALEGARLLDPLANLDSVTFDVEREVVRNELRLRNETGYYSQLLSWAQSAAFPAKHPYSRPLIGTHESLSSITLQDARQFVAKHYRPDNIVLTVVGDLSIATISETLDRALPPELWQSTTPSAQRGRAEVTIPADAPQGELQRFTASVASPQLLLAWALPRVREDDDLLVESIVKLLNFGLLRVDDDDVASARTGVVTGRDGSLLICEVLLKQGSHPEKSAERVLDQIQLGGQLTALRFEQLRFGAHAYLAYELEDMERRALFLARAAFSSKAEQAYTRAVKALERMSIDELVSFTGQYLNRARASAAYFVPSTTDSFEGEMEGRSLIEAPDDRVTVLYPPEAIRSIIHPVPTKQFQTLQLKNGLEVIIAPRSAWPLVTVELAIRGGSATARPLGVVELSRLARPRRFGLHGFPSEYGIQIRDAIAADATLTQLKAGSANFEVALALLSDGVQRLQVKDSAISEFRKRSLPLMETLERTPRRRSERALWEALLPIGPFSSPATTRDLGRLEAEEIERWLEQTNSPSNSVLAIVGDVDPVEAPKAVERWLGGWEGPQPGGNKTQVRMASLRNPAERKSILVTHRPAATQVEIQLGCAFQANTPADALSYQILAELIAQALSDSAREKLGATYGFYASPKALQEIAFRLVVRGAVDNGSFSHVLTLIREHWPRPSGRDLSSESINRIRWDIARQYNLRYSTSAALADAIVRGRLRGWPADVLESFPDLLLAVTPDDLRRAASNCEKTAVLSIVGDEKVVNLSLKGAESTP